MNKRKSHLLKILAITIVLLFMEIVLSLNTIIAEEVEFIIIYGNCFIFKYNNCRGSRI